MPDSEAIMRTLVQMAEIDSEQLYRHWRRSGSTCLCICHMMISLSLLPAAKSGLHFVRNISDLSHALRFNHHST